MDRRQLQRQRQRQRRPTMSNIVRMMAIATCYIAVCSAFTTPVSLKLSSSQQQHTTTKVWNGRTRSRTTTTTTTASATPTTTSALQAENKSPQQTADFDYQELQIQMNAMKQQNIKPSQLDPIKRNELRRYVENILAFRQRSSTSALAVDSSVPLHMKLRSSLPGTKWRMAFTTEPLMAEALPKDATIMMTFASGTGNAATGSNKVDYGLDFFKTLALKRLVVKSTYTVMDPTPNDPTAAVVEIVYDKVSTDIFGFSNVGIGTFGMLKGRSTYIQTVYYDDKIWIESGVDGEGNDSQIYYNVYARDYDTDEEEEEDESW